MLLSSTPVNLSVETMVVLFWFSSKLTEQFGRASGAPAGLHSDMTCWFSKYEGMTTVNNPHLVSSKGIPGNTRMSTSNTIKHPKGSQRGMGYCFVLVHFHCLPHPAKRSLASLSPITPGHWELHMPNSGAGLRSGVPPELHGQRQGSRQLAVGRLGPATELSKVALGEARGARTWQIPGVSF